MNTGSILTENGSSGYAMCHDQIEKSEHKKLYTFPFSIFDKMSQVQIMIRSLQNMII